MSHKIKIVFDSIAIYEDMYVVLYVFYRKYLSKDRFSNEIGS